MFSGRFKKSSDIIGAVILTLYLLAGKALQILKI